MKQIILLIAMFLETTYFVTTAYASDGGETQIERFALIIGMNNGGEEREKLRYATSDASSFGRTLSDLGGVNKQNSIILLEPSKNKILDNLNAVKEKIKDSKKTSNKRSELFVYYSGHSDEEGLLLGNDKLLYRDLKKNIDAVLADVSVVILDSCASGALTKVKGGKMKAPFLTDDSTNLKGRVFLTSSSSDEVAQESDRIKGSYFTHYLVSGLRGAADTKGDGKITLNEAYHYAYNETLAKTEKMMKGVQHPSYDIQLAGSGELIMTDVKDASARILIPKTVSGRLFIRDQAENLVVEVNKMPGKSLALGLSEGEYSINLRKDNTFYQAKVVLKNDKLAYVNESDFQNVAGESASIRGDDRGIKYVSVPLEVGVVPKLSTNSNDHELTENNVNLSLVYAETARVNGLILSFGGTWVNEDVRGGQMSILFNNAGGDVQGGQLGVVNIVNGNLKGVQIGGVNWIKNDFTGATYGYMNIAKNSYGAQIGAINWTQENFSGIGLGHLNIANNSRGVKLGLVNWENGNLDGVNLGLLNVNRKSVRGAQLGLLNVATEKSQVQVGLVNYTEDSESLPVGLINIVKHGTFNMSVSLDENDFKDLTFKYGSKYSYSYFGLGNNSDFNRFNVGIGGRYPIGDFSMNLEIGYLSMHSKPKIRNLVGRNLSASVNQIKLFPKYKIFDHVNLFAGGTYNSFNSVLSYRELEEASLHLRSGGKSGQKWIGYFGGLELEI